MTGARETHARAGNPIGGRQPLRAPIRHQCTLHRQNAPATESMFEIPEEAIEKVAEEIRRRTSKDHQIPVLGTADNLETPQIFEIVAFDRIDTLPNKFFAVDGSHNFHTFYNGLTVALYRAGYVCFHKGQQLRLTNNEDPLALGKMHQGSRMLILSPSHAEEMYDELLTLPPVVELLKLFGEPPPDVFGYGKEQV